MRAPLVLLAALLLCASRGQCAPLRITIELREDAGVARRDETVTTAVPFPQGRLRSADGLWIAAPGGAAAPSQAAVRERWPDGSVRWLRVDFVASVAQGARASYALRDGNAPPAPSTAVVRRTPEGSGTLLESGSVALRVAPSSSGMAELRRGDQAVATVTLPTVDLGGEAPRPSVDPAVEVETEGPVLTEVLVKGRAADDLTWESRLAVSAGSPTVRMQLTVEARPVKPYVHVRSLPLALRGAFDEPALGIDGDRRGFRDGRAHRLRQRDAAPAGCSIDGTACRAGDGWVAARTAGGTLLAVRRWFREEWPQAIAVGPKEVTLDLLAGADDPLPLGVGAAKTFELWIGAGVFPDPEATARALQAPLTALVDPRWVAASRALPHAVAPDGVGAAELLPRLATAIGRYLARNRAERWDDGAPVACEARTVERERIGAFGALNWGDWNFPGYRDRSEGCDAWGNLEYDLTEVLGLAWAATGTPSLWEAFVAAARHYRDVDIIHHAPGFPEWVGFNHPHKARHFAVESPNKVDLGHTWLEGLVTHYRLSGERRSLDAARGIADVLVNRRQKAGNARQYGWPMVALAAAWDATGEIRYRDAALGYATGAIAAHEPSPASGDWKMGILADGIASVHAATGDERLRDWLVRYADAFVATPERFDDPRYALPLGYVAGLTGDARQRATALAVVDRMPIGDWGKTLAISGRTALRILADLGGVRVASTPGRAETPRPSAGGSRRSSPSR